MFGKVLLCISSVFVIINGDCYLHYPRGSNNRLNEQSANRDNANRLFDSQNNNRGGYNVCDCDVDEGFNANDWMATANEMYDMRFLWENNDNTAANVLEKQYEEVFFTESVLSTTWTVQHGSFNKKLLSQIILQFTCDTNPRPTPGDNQIVATQYSGPFSDIPGNDVACATGNCRNTRQKMRAMGLRMELMNGGSRNTPEDANSFTNGNNVDARYGENNAGNDGRHESEEYYRYCETRKRNYGLFKADQNLQGDSQKYTRQNPGGTRRGLECPEERDYYPWWNPNPWHDIAILTHDKQYCENYVKTESQNVKDKCMCLKPTWNTETGSSIFNTENTEDYAMYNLDSTECTDMGGVWECFKWGAGATDFPECFEGVWGKVNHLGNVDNKLSKVGPKQAHYDWKLPSMEYLHNLHYCWKYNYKIEGDINAATDPPTYTSQGGTEHHFDWGGNLDVDRNIECVRMVFRIRYNMSTADYDPYKTDYNQNDRPNEGKISPIRQNPEIDVGVLAQGIQLAINTAQTGRTFQDRTHTFLVCSRPPASDPWIAKDIMNVGVRGKRGNIVQTFPATEYDFEPQHMFAREGQCIHFQWCGSNTHNNGAPGGDGQTGDAGEGQGGTDRSNIVQTFRMDESYPVAYDKIPDILLEYPNKKSFFDHVTCYHPFQSQTPLSSKDAQIVLGTAGFYKSYDYANRVITELRDSPANEYSGDGEDAILNELLNNVSASFRSGLICCINENILNSCDNDYHIPFSFISTRNNNFSNRSQKLKIVIACDPDFTDFVNQRW